MYTIQFSPYFEGILNSCGTGHIRFWKMASTFTGLKLQASVVLSAGWGRVEVRRPPATFTGLKLQAGYVWSGFMMVYCFEGMASMLTGLERAAGLGSAALNPNLLP